MITTTGNPVIDQATAEIAVALRDASPGKRDQDYYDEASRLRDAILSGARNAPVQERAPEVGRLLATIRGEIEGPDGDWNGGDVVQLLCTWFTALGYDIGDSDQACSQCGDRVATLSSRYWCDGCEEEAARGGLSD